MTPCSCVAPCGHWSLCVAEVGVTISLRPQRASDVQEDGCLGAGTNGVVMTWKWKVPELSQLP